MPPETVEGPGALPLGFLVAAAGQQVMTAFRRRLDSSGLHPRAFAVLWQLSTGAGQSQQDLSQALHLPASRMVGLVAALEERGLVDRVRHPTDGRARVVRLTDAGRRTVSELGAVARDFDDELRAGLSEPEIATLRALVTRMLANLGPGADAAGLRVW